MPTPITTVRGIGNAAAADLAAVGIDSAEDLAEAAPDRIVAAKGFGPARAAQVKEAAAEALMPADSRTPSEPPASEKAPVATEEPDAATEIPDKNDKVIDITLKKHKTGKKTGKNKKEKTKTKKDADDKKKKKGEKEKKDKKGKKKK